ncbi:hypothetical protein [Methanospirillum sp.]|nr:hypothetical protein [Methanospirillum sp.]HOL41644.1 hypothetical protein [Methanospirillum sp.]
MDIFAPFSENKRVMKANCFGSPIVRIVMTARSDHLQVYWTSL